MTDWPLHDAKNRFSAVVDAALSGEPQRVTRRGRPAVVVLAVAEYERLCRFEQANAPTLAGVAARHPTGRPSVRAYAAAKPPTGPVMFLIDTDVLSALRRRGPLPGGRALVGGAAYGGPLSERDYRR